MDIFIEMYVVVKYSLAQKEAPFRLSVRTLLGTAGENFKMGYRNILRLVFTES